MCRFIYELKKKNARAVCLKFCGTSVRMLNSRLTRKFCVCVLGLYLVVMLCLRGGLVRSIDLHFDSFPNGESDWVFDDVQTNALCVVCVFLGGLLGQVRWLPFWMINRRGTHTARAGVSKSYDDLFSKIIFVMSSWRSFGRNKRHWMKLFYYWTHLGF